MMGGSPNIAGSTPSITLLFAGKNVRLGFLAGPRLLLRVYPNGFTRPAVASHVSHPFC